MSTPSSHEPASAGNTALLPTEVIDLRDADQISQSSQVDADGTWEGGKQRSDQETPAPRISPIFAALLAVAFVAWCAISGNLTTLGVGLALGFMIFLHELGHFITARMTGMKATEFFVGFGPRIWSFRRGETEYGIKAIPLGGYVKILGMANTEQLADPADEPRTYRQQSYPKRVLVASAGSIVHMLIAIVCFFSVFSIFGERQINVLGMQVTEVAPILNGNQSPAAQAGIKVGDVLLTVNGKEVKGNLPELFAGTAGTDVTVEVGDVATFTRRTVIVRPAFDDAMQRPRIGITTQDNVTEVTIKRHSVGAGAVKSVKQIGELAPLTFKGLSKFFAPDQLSKYSTALANAGDPNATKPINDTRFMSPVGTVSLLSQATKSDFRDGLLFFAAINVFVGMFNMLPMLPLDGGHVLVATYERLRSRKGKRYIADVAKLMPATYAVMAVMLFLGITALYLDIRSPLRLP